MGELRGSSMTVSSADRVTFPSRRLPVLTPVDSRLLVGSCTRPTTAMCVCVHLECVGSAHLLFLLVQSRSIAGVPISLHHHSDELIRRPCPSSSSAIWVVVYPNLLQSAVDGVPEHEHRHF